MLIYPPIAYITMQMQFFCFNYLRAFNRVTEKYKYACMHMYIRNIIELVLGKRIGTWNIKELILNSFPKYVENCILSMILKKEQTKYNGSFITGFHIIKNLRYLHLKNSLYIFFELFNNMCFLPANITVYRFGI